jgi:hypothetical protein
MIVGQAQPSLIYVKIVRYGPTRALERIPTEATRPRVIRGRPKRIFVLVAVVVTIFEVDLGRSSIDPDRCEKYHASSPAFSNATVNIQPNH